MSMQNIENYYDGQGNIGELESYPDGVAVARLMKPGASRGEVRMSQCLKVGMLWSNGREPDQLYDRFEGQRDAAVAWLTSHGFQHKPSARVVLTPEQAAAVLNQGRVPVDLHTMGVGQ